MKFRKVIFKALFFLFLTVAFTSTAFAQSASGLSITVSPVVIDLVAKPGQTATADLRVKNNGTTPEQLTIHLMKFTAIGDTGKPQIEERGPNDSYFDWVKFSENSFSIAPNEWKTIHATFTIPKTAAFGYYYAVTFTRQGKSASSGTTPVASITGASAILVLLDVQTGNEKRQVELVDFSADKSFYEFLPVTFKVTIKNTGNIHIIPEGNIFIGRGDARGSDVDLISINKPQGNILPGTNRIFSPQWANGFPVYQTVTSNSGKVNTELKWNLSSADKFRFGKYTARLLLVYNNGERDIPMEGTLTFWVIPWKILAGAAVIIIFVLIGFFFTIRSVWKKIRRQ